MTTADRLDSARDAAALVAAVHRGDHEAREVILQHADHQAVAEALAGVTVRIIRTGVRGCDHCVDLAIADWQAWLRDTGGSGVGGGSS